MNEIGAKPVEYLVLAWISGIGSALLCGALAAVVAVAYTGEFDDPLWQQALAGVLAALLVAMVQLLIAQTACFVILHSRSQHVTVGAAIGTGHRNSNIVVALPFETTGPSRFWVAVHTSGWRVLLSIYAGVLAIVVSSATQNALPALPLVAAAVALGFWHASHYRKKKSHDALDAAAAEAKAAASEKARRNRERSAERASERAATAPITDEWIDRELKKAFTATAIRAAKNGDASALDTAARRAFTAMHERVPLDDLRDRAIAWVGRQP